MIRYIRHPEVIQRLVRKRMPTWQARALQRTQYHQTVGRFIKTGETLPDGKKAHDFWSEVKGVFLTAQFAKCIYCEKRLEASAIEWDLEHFRPKDAVTAWPYRFPTGPALPGGYYLLAYDLENYAASCKTCNTIHKSTYFPIAHARVANGSTVAAHQSEGAHLVYPHGDNAAEDPEAHIGFVGAQAVARKGSVRGQVMIDLLKLNRDALQRDRAQWLVLTVWKHLEEFGSTVPSPSKDMKWLLSEKAPFTNCTRCFVDLFVSNQAEATRQYQIMRRILNIQ